MLLGLLTLFLSASYYPRQIIMTSLLVVARVELAAYLFSRVLRRGHDSRFDEMRSHFISFLGFWILQMIWAFTTSLPVMFVNGDPANPPLNGWDGVGIALFVIGFACQVAADVQKDAWRRNPANAHAVCSVGLWGYSRHPNFFGEITMWTGSFLQGIPVYEASAVSWGWVCVLSPLVTMWLLLLVSGIPTSEGPLQERYCRTEQDKAAYLAYRNRTSPVIPLPPALYAGLPLWVKRWCLCELSMYEAPWGDYPSSAANPRSPLVNERSKKNSDEGDVSSLVPPPGKRA